MFNKILIANRGEIACRVMETARKLGVETVAIYSDADEFSKHTQMADEAWRVGPAPVADSYLQMDRIIEIAIKSGAEAIHPGYGFLSENPDFVDKITSAGLIFIGPSSSAIRAMGLKDSAKKLMIEAGVPVVPGYHGDNQDPNFLAKEADKIGYPVLIKARAGGGGKGMRKVDDPADFSTNLAAAQREGLSSFGDAACLIEKWITTPRHIEIQVFGDNFGNVVHLFERDCSMQRRHQKVIEESPAPGMTLEMREKMGESAVLCAKSIGYSGAGTIEFIVDASDGLDPNKYWFMEMNTRLQVEHPVTECVTGVDLVDWQIRVAFGEKLPLQQDSIPLNGHAFEARIYAEDVPAGFLPATGSIEALSFPNAVRIDSGIRQNDDISPWYDPMIAKVIVHGDTREIALSKLRTALDSCRIDGTKTNLNFLSSLCRHKKFTTGLVDTGLIENELNSLVQESTAPPIIWAIAGVMAADQVHNGPLFGWSMWLPLKRTVNLKNKDNFKKLLISQTNNTSFSVVVDDDNLPLEIIMADDRIRLFDGNKWSSLMFSRSALTLTVYDNSEKYVFDVVEFESSNLISTEVSNFIKSPMPGIVRQVNAVAGKKYSAGEVILVVEAMKMEHSLSAEFDCCIAEICVSVGDQVTLGEILVVLEGADG